MNIQVWPYNLGIVGVCTSVFFYNSRGFFSNSGGSINDRTRGFLPMLCTLFPLGMQKIGNIHKKAFLNRQSLMRGELKLHLRLEILSSWFTHLLSALSKLNSKRDKILDLFGFSSAYDLISIGLLLMMTLDCGKHDGCSSRRIQAISFQTLKSFS